MDLLSLGKNPIHPDAPTGSDIRYDPDFEALQAEIDKLSSPTSTEGVDWSKVSDNAARILSEKSKDLTAASYLAVSQLHINRIDGLAVGVTILRDLLEHYWENLFPPKKRMRGRIGAIDFWVEKCEAALGGMHETVDANTLDRIKQTLLDLDELLQKYLPDPPPLHFINRHINALMVQATENGARELPPEPDAADRSHPSPEASVEAEPHAKAPLEIKPEKSFQPAPAKASETDSGGMESEQDANKNANAGFQKIRSAGVRLFEEDSKNPEAYRFRRIASWAKISALPPARDGKTQILPPSAQEISAIENLKADSNWEVLLATAEQKLSRFVFWLDLCRHSAEALIHMGEAYQAAHKALCDETAYFMMRIPGLEDLAFSDGMPFADPETRPWLKQIGLGSISDRAGQVSLGASESTEKDAVFMSEIVDKAKELARRKKVMEAVGLIQEQLQRSAAEKMAFSWRMVLCQILLGSTFKNVAVPHLEQIISDIEKYHLEAWDPDVALKGLAMAWAGFHAMPDSRFSDRADELLHRISRLDPAEALRLSR